MNDTTNQIVIYSKEKNNKSLILCLKAIENHKSNYSMVKDAKQIISTFKFDTSVKDALDYFKIFNAYKDEDNFLYVLNKFDKAPIEENKENEWTKLQMLLTLLSNDSEYFRYQEMLNDFEFKRKTYLKTIIDSINRIQADVALGENDIISQIKTLTKDEKVVMLNENHWYPKHRIFATKLLKPLKSNGFKYLAIEAVDKDKDTVLDKRAFPTRSTGFYIREQFFGIFIREAIKEGFTILSYDDFSTDNREETQAHNLKKIIDTYPQEKIFVYAGIDHILEKNKKKKRMAEFFTEITGINPLTIDQVELVSNTVENIALYNSKLFDKVKNVNTNVDYFLINNYDASLSEVSTDRLHSFIIEDEKLKKYNNKEVLVSIYNLNEYEAYKTGSIPILNRIKVINKGSITVEIPKGNFYMRVRDINNKLILSKKITN